MNTNLDYENANNAIVLIKNGKNVNDAVELSNAKIH